MAFNSLINSCSLTGEISQDTPSTEDIRNLFREAAGEDSGLYDRFTEVIFKIFTLPLGRNQVFTYNLFSLMIYRIPYNVNEINSNIPPKK
jgi:hypothetical protein